LTAHARARRFGVGTASVRPDRAVAVWPQPGVTVLVLATFGGTGMAKGMVGSGFPAATVAVRAATVGLAPAIAVTAVPWRS
jgi:hypothetical protein